MAMSREQKKQEVEALKERFENDELFVVAHYAGLTVSEMTDLRAKLREEGASFKVTKNTLAKRAIEGTDVEYLADYFSGPTGVASSEDPVAAARVTYEFAKKNKKLVILGGGMGAKALDKAGVEQLAQLPSMDELRSKLIGLIQAPAGQLARLSKAPAGKLARVMAAYAEANK